MKDGHLKAFWLIAVIAIVSICPVQAAEFCATTPAQLQTALSIADSNGQNDVIRVAEGTYDAPSGGFSYSAIAGENNDLEVSGGWSEFFGNPCGQQLGGRPNTILNGQLLVRALDVVLRTGGDVTISRLIFQNGFVGDPNEGSGLRVWAAFGLATGYDGVIRIERNLFFNNEASRGGGLSLLINGTGAVQAHVLNNILAFNHGRDQSGAVHVQFGGGDDNLFGARMAFINNTVTGNTTDSTMSGATGGVFLGGSVPARYIINNNLWDNQTLDLRVASTSSSLVFRHNNFEDSQFSQTPTSEAGNITVEPEYEPCGSFFCLNFVPRIGSPLVDGGTEPGTFSAWDTGTVDYHGKDRIHGQTIDIGASESHALIFADRYEQ